MNIDADGTKGQQLVARVEYERLVEVPESLRDGAFRFVVQPRREGVRGIRYLEAAARSPTGRDLMAVVSLGTIDSPDEFLVQEAWLDDDRVFLHMHLRDFQGRLAANVLRLALVVVDLGDLAPGRYHAEVLIDRSVVTGDGPTGVSNVEHSSSRRIDFEIAGV